MNPEVKEKWLAALESGKYKQGKDRLKTTDDGRDKFCCLGVLCDISGLGEWKGGDTGGWRYEISEDDSNKFYLPGAVAEWAGLSREGGEVFAGGKMALLPNHNDSGRRFKTIAKAIREQL